MGNLSANAGVAAFQEWDGNILTGISKDRGVLGGPWPDHSTPSCPTTRTKGFIWKKPQRSGLPQNVNTCHDESWVPPKIRHQLPPGGETSPGHRAAGCSGRNPAVSTYIKAEDWVRFLGLLIRQHFGLRNVPVDSAEIYLLNSAQAHLCKSLANSGTLRPSAFSQAPPRFRLTHLLISGGIWRWEKLSHYPHSSSFPPLSPGVMSYYVNLWYAAPSLP